VRSGGTRSRTVSSDACTPSTHTGLKYTVRYIDHGRAIVVVLYAARAGPWSPRASDAVTVEQGLPGGRAAPFYAHHVAGFRPDVPHAIASDSRMLGNCSFDESASAASYHFLNGHDGVAWDEDVGRDVCRSCGLKCSARLQSCRAGTDVDAGELSREMPWQLRAAPPRAPPRP
jgi:hypothetical protein